MILPVSDKYRIATDTHSWMVQRLRSRKRKGVNVQEWEAVTWHSSVQQAVQSLGDRMVRASEAETFADALVDVENVCAKLCQALQPEFKVHPNLNWSQAKRKRIKGAA